MTNTIFYRYDPKQSKVEAIKLEYSDPNNLEALARVAKIHIPVVEALKKDSKNIFEVIDLDLPNLPVTLKVIDVVERN